MTSGKSSSQAGGKPNILGALSDFIILVLLLAGAGFGGYFWGTTQRLAPVRGVPAGTAGALPAPALPVPGQPPAQPPAEKSAPAGDLPAKAGAASDNPPAGGKKPRAAQKTKYWLTSDGADYTGYSVTVSVNGTAVDNFFGPGKTVDISRYVKEGENSILFEAKALGDQYNKHKGDEKSVLSLYVVSGPSIREDYGKSDIVLSYERNAAESTDFSDTLHFVKE